MASDIAATENNNWWTLPPAFEEQWKTLVKAFGLVEGYPDEPLGNGVLCMPQAFSDEQKQILTDVLKLRQGNNPILPGSYSDRNFPGLSIGAFEIGARISNRVNPSFGLTIETKTTIQRLAGRQWMQLPTSYFLPKEVREDGRLAEQEHYQAIARVRARTSDADIIGLMLGGGGPKRRHIGLTPG